MITDSSGLDTFVRLEKFMIYILMSISLCTSMRSDEQIMILESCKLAILNFIGCSMQPLVNREEIAPLMTLQKDLFCHMCRNRPTRLQILIWRTSAQLFNKILPLRNYYEIKANSAFTYMALKVKRFSNRKSLSIMKNLSSDKKENGT